MANFQPETFGKYYLVDHIATGGMAEIYKAKTYSHGGFENLLVIKRILPHIGAKQDFVDMFIDEAKVSVALQHPNIVRIYDFGKLLDNYFMAMECVDGKDVRQILRQLARDGVYLPFRFAAFIALETCKGLQYAHDKVDVDGNPYGIVHRDISPSNVLVSYEGEVKVADFGIAKAESNAYETKDGVLKGKFEYMSPEQAKGVTIDHRSDVFSLGIIFYEMLTGRRLFKTDSDTATLRKIRDEDVPAPSLVKPDVPPALEAIALKALTRSLDGRYATAAEMADDLRQYLFPATPDSLRDELAAFMKQLFAGAIHDEKVRLSEGSAIAAQLKRDRPDWDESQTGTLSVTQTAVRLVAPTMLGGGVVLVLLLGVGGVASYLAWSQGWLDPLLQVEQTTGSVDVMVVPEARVLVNGKLEGTSSTLTLDELPPGAYVIRLEADGFVPLERTVLVAEGQQVKVVEQLTPEPKADVPKPVEAPEPQVGGGDESGPPKVRFESTPPGAQVTVNGRAVGTTPMTYTAPTGTKLQVAMALDGYAEGSSTVRALEEGDRRNVRLTLEEAATPGALTVTLSGGWAHVYVDGVQLKKTAPLRDLPIDPGGHEVRVVNEALGIDHTETVQVASGASVTVKAAAQ